jgi:hypothetical protein
MQLGHPHAIRLEGDEPAALSREEILAATVRMTLIHGTSVEDALRRLESLCLMADLGPRCGRWSPQGFSSSLSRSTCPT